VQAFENVNKLQESGKKVLKSEMKADKKHASGTKSSIKDNKITAKELQEHITITINETKFIHQKYMA
jgi:hypothetical protein